jgi:hypothetical protein
MPTVILVHGVRASGSNWHKVIKELIKHGLDVVVAQIPLTSMGTQWFMANRAGSTVRFLQIGRMPLLSHPQEVANLIAEAAHANC